MDITWYGNSCFRITERGHTTVLTDPSPSLDLAQRGLRADLVTLSHERAGAALDDIRGEPYKVEGPGEYEIGELFVSGIALHVHGGEGQAPERNTAYHFEYPNSLNFLHLGALRQLPEQAVIEQFDEVHALMLPLGGALSHDQLADLTNMIEPRFVLPMHGDQLDQAAFAAARDGYCKAMGLTSPAPLDTLRLTAASLGEGTQVACLRRAS